jgi:cobalt-zinc-cadmium efflux system outer membrane protein
MPSPPTVKKDEAHPAEVQVTWPDIVAMVDQHPVFLAGKFHIQAAHANVSAAGAVPNPTLEGTLGQGRAKTGGASRVEWGLSLTLPLGWIAERGPRIDEAEAEVAVAVAESKALRTEVMLRLRMLFWTLASEQAKVSSLEALEAQTAALIHSIRRRVETGEARPVEAIRVEIELEKIRAELTATRTTLSVRQAELGLWLSVPSGKTLVVAADFETLPVAMDRQTAQEKARASYPSLTVALARARFLETELKSERRVRVPQFGLTGFATNELDRRAYGVGLAIDLPIWNWNGGQIAKATAKLAAGRKQADATRLDVEAMVLDLQGACQASVLTATRFKNHVLPLSRTATAMVEKTYQQGEISLLEVLDAQRTLLDAHRNYLNALTHAQIDCNRLGAMVGE